MPHAVHPGPRLINVDHLCGAYPLEDPHVLGPQPAAHPPGHVQHSGRRHLEPIGPLEGLADLPVGQPFLELHEGSLDQDVLPEPAARGAVRVPGDGVGPALRAHPLKLKKIYYLPGMGVHDLLYDVVIYNAGLPQGRPAALAPLFPLWGLHCVWPRPGPRSPRMPSRPLGEPFSAPDARATPTT